MNKMWRGESCDEDVYEDVNANANANADADDEDVVCIWRSKKQPTNNIFNLQA